MKIGQQIYSEQGRIYVDSSFGSQFFTHGKQISPSVPKLDSYDQMPRMRSPPPITHSITTARPEDLKKAYEKERHPKVKIRMAVINMGVWITKVSGKRKTRWCSAPTGLHMMERIKEGRMEQRLNGQISS